MTEKRILYFDSQSGIAGNMILGALIDLGVSLKELKQELAKLPITGYKLHVNKHLLTVRIPPHDQHRNLADITKIINKSRLSNKVKTLSLKIFNKLARAEAKVHGISLNKVHFHEVGAIDAIIDIVGSAICIDKLSIEAIYCSPLPHGTGKIKCAHGILPNPAPATVELLKGVPTYGTKIKGELVTPTGAAIITSLTNNFGDCPRIIIEKIGHGAGSSKLIGTTNMLRVFSGQAKLPTKKDAILQIETNIDDMDPKLYDKAIAKIMKAGALDASIHPIRMKKKRNAYKLEILCNPENKDKILEVLFTETTTIGTRVYLVTREILRREIKNGEKVSYLGTQVKRRKKE